MRKHTKTIFALFLIILAFFVTRLITLTDIPIFTDEAIYLRWAQIANADANWRFISLTDGKQPLFIWLIMGFMRFISDPLVAGRLVSVSAGFLTMIGLFLLGKELFKNKWVGITSAGIYAIFPFAMVYDRLALYDSLVGTFSIWGLYVTVLLVRYVRLDLAFILGFVTSGAVLNKSNGFFTIYLFPFALILFDFFRKDKYRKLFKLFGLFLVVIVMTNITYSILRLSAFFYLISEKNAFFVYPFREWIIHPFQYIISNFNGLWDWFVLYMKLPFILAVVIAFVIDKKYFKEKTLLFLWFALPFIMLDFFGKTLYPRYILFMTLSLLPLIAYTIVQGFYLIKNKMLFLILCIALCSLSLWTSYQVLFNFPNASIPKSDIWQLYSDWPSGAGVKESIEFFKKQEQKNGHIFIATEGTFGLMPYAYELYVSSDPHVVKGYWPIGKTPPSELIEKSKMIPTYFVFYQGCPLCQGELAPLTWNVHQVFQYKRLTPNSYLTIYEIIP